MAGPQCARFSISRDPRHQTGTSTHMPPLRGSSVQLQDMDDTLPRQFAGHVPYGHGAEESGNAAVLYLDEVGLDEVAKLLRVCRHTHFTATRIVAGKFRLLGEPTSLAGLLILYGSLSGRAAVTKAPTRKPRLPSIMEAAVSQHHATMRSPNSPPRESAHSLAQRGLPARPDQPLYFEYSRNMVDRSSPRVTFGA